jgi:hypothetical protein
MQTPPMFFLVWLAPFGCFYYFCSFLPSSGPSYPSSFQANPAIELTSKDHGSDCESSGSPLDQGASPTPPMFERIDPFWLARYVKIRSDFILLLTNFKMLECQLINEIDWPIFLIRIFFLNRRKKQYIFRKPIQCLSSVVKKCQKLTFGLSHLSNDFFRTPSSSLGSPINDVTQKLLVFF